MCRVLPIAPSSYYKHAARQKHPTKAPARTQRDQWLCEEIRRVWKENFQELRQQEDYSYFGGKSIK